MNVDGVYERYQMSNAYIQVVTHYFRDSTSINNKGKDSTNFPTKWMGQLSKNHDEKLNSRLTTVLKKF